MKTYKEMADAVLERRDMRLKNRKEAIKFSAVFISGVASLCLAVVLGINFLTPEKPISVAQGGNNNSIKPGGNVGAVTSKFEEPIDSMIDGDAPISVQSKFEGQVESQTSEPSTNQDLYLPALYINDLENVPAAASKRYFDPEKYDKIELNEQQTQEYFAKKLVPNGAVRSPLKKVSDGSSVQYVEKERGKIVYDSTCIEYSNGVYPDGSPLSPTDDGSNLTVWASKLGRPNVCYLWGDGKYTELKGVKVCAGKIEVGYDYNENKEPTAFYTTYFAEFEVDGVFYEVTADNVSVEEFTRAVWGIIAY